MSLFKQIDDHLYVIKSKNIQVTPCANRGTITDTINDNEITHAVDSESRMQTERTIVNRYPKGVEGKNSYIINYMRETTPGTTTHKDTLEFSINGYYFKITGTSDSDSFFDSFLVPDPLNPNDQSDTTPGNITHVSIKEES